MTIATIAKNGGTLVTDNAIESSTGTLQIAASASAATVNKLWTLHETPGYLQKRDEPTI